MLPLVYGAIVGLSLGLTGGGGSIFAVPFLIYGLGLDFRQAVAVSLAVVGLTALYGAALQARRGHVLWGAGAVLGLGGIVAAPLGAVIGSHLPAQLSLGLFAALMLFIGVRMLRGVGGGNDVPLSWISCERQADGRPRFSPLCASKLLTAGAVTGVLSGVFGVGGGFLVVPALLVVTCVSIERALATSLVGICLISASGFAANFGNITPAVIPLALTFLGGSALGMTSGAWLKKFVAAALLSKFFGISVVATAIYVLLRSVQAT